jgi:hypothetical protein
MGMFFLGFLAGIVFALMLGKIINDREDKE